MFVETIVEKEFLIAISKGVLFHVEKLINKEHIDVNMNNGIALIRAVNHGRNKIVSLLFENKCKIPTEQSKKILLTACQKGFTKIAEMLIENGQDIYTTIDYGEALIEAVKYCHTYCVKMLLKYKADIFYDDSNALILACKENNNIVIKLLIENNCDVNTRNSYPLIMACRSQNLPLVRQLLQAGAYIPDFLIQEVVMRKDIPIIIELLQYGAKSDFEYINVQMYPILSQFLKSRYYIQSRWLRLKIHVHESWMFKKLTFKWEKYVSTTYKGSLIPLKEQAKLFDIDSNIINSNNKRLIAYNLTLLCEKLESERIIYSEDMVDLSGTPINELPVWKIMEINGIPFNCFDLFRLIHNQMYTNPYTREILPVDKIKKKEIFLEEILCEFQLKNFDLVQVVSNIPIRTKENILSDRLLHELWNKIAYTPPMKLILNATDLEIDEMLDKLYFCCSLSMSISNEVIIHPSRRLIYRGEDDNRGYSFNLYTMCNKQIEKKIKNLKDFEKKVEFVNLLIRIINQNDEHKDVRIFMMTLFLKHIDLTMNTNATTSNREDSYDWLQEHISSLDVLAMNDDY